MSALNMIFAELLVNFSLQQNTSPTKHRQRVLEINNVKKDKAQGQRKRGNGQQWNSNLVPGMRFFFVTGKGVSSMVYAVLYSPASRMHQDEP